MKKKKHDKKMGRPVIKIDFGMFKKLCEMQCTKEEIAGWFECSEDTIERRCKEEYGETFAVIYKEFSAKGKISLRRAQFKLAQHNSMMAKWLGKQYLGQRERTELDMTSKGEKLEGFIVRLADGETEE
jgi:hypothetical protein